ncbi:MAG: hypoxanthine phosphoribosyltransferase [Nitrospiraceae bacterium]|nr:hypoxanthine phosphoribosyltransferase [Nitrospiraceae bacterium]
MRPLDPPLFSADQIARRVVELAHEIDADLEAKGRSGDLLLIAVLKGSVVFVADLMRGMATPVSIEFIRARGYEGTESSGNVELTYLPEQSVAGRNVLLVEDILDTGRTADVILQRLRAEGPAHLALCALLDKPSRREVEVEADYVGFTIDDFFVVGYGLDYNQQGRDWPAIHVLPE